MLITWKTGVNFKAFLRLLCYRNEDLLGKKVCHSIWIFLPKKLIFSLVGSSSILCLILITSSIKREKLMELICAKGTETNL